MKTYDEAVKFVVDDLTTGIKRYRYYTWPMVETIATIYNVSLEKVGSDINSQVEQFYKNQRQEIRKQRREEQEQRLRAKLTT